MGLRDVARFATATQGIAQAGRNLQAVRAAREKKRKDDEMFERNKKITDLKIEQLEASGQKSRQESMIFKSLVDEMFKQKKKIREGQEALIDQEETKQMGQIKQFRQVAEEAAKNPDALALLIGTSVGASEGDTRPIAQNINPRLPAKRTQIDNFKIDIGPSGQSQIKRKSESEIFNEEFKKAESAGNFEQLEQQFPQKRKEIKEQRIQGLPEKSQRLLGQIEREIKADEKAARKDNTISNPEDVIADFLIEIVENKESAKRAGHDVDQILDILGVTEEEILANQDKPSEGFLGKIANLSPILATLKVLRK